MIEYERGDERLSNPYTGLASPLGLQEFDAPRFSGESNNEGGKVVSHMYQQPLPLWKYSL
jgi:hypothetical protein